MHKYHILAQSMFSSRRIQQTMSAASESAALRSVGNELENAGYYVISITLVQ